MSRSRMAVFVYGTLKKNQRNHHWLQDRANGFAQFVCPASTSKRLPLVVATRYNIPFLLKRPGVGSYVAGELYNVDEKMMATLDRLEDYTNLYDREQMDLNLGINEGTTKGWVYLVSGFPEEMLKLRHYAEYKESSERPYVEPAKRDPKVSAKDDLLYGVDN